MVERNDSLNKLTRRQLLQQLTLNGLGLVLWGCSSPPHRIDPTPVLAATPEPPTQTPPAVTATALKPAGPVRPDRLTPTNYLMSLGEETAISLAAQKISWTPDLHLPYVYLDQPKGSRRYFISGNAGSFRLDLTGTLYGLRNNLKAVSAWPNYQYDRAVRYRNGYAAIGTVLQTDPRRAGYLLGFTHNEERASGGPGNSNDDDKFTASIGLVESQDGGATWKDYGPAITGDDTLSPGTRATGAGQPSAIVNGQYVYIYYIDWAAGRKVSHPDQIYLARSRIQPDGFLSKIEYFTKDGFSTPGAKPENLEPVIAAAAIEGGGYAALPSVSYNTYLKQYLCVFETNVGFAAVKSADGIKWQEAGLIAWFPQPHSGRKFGDIWYSYPTLLSDESQGSDQITEREGILYCSRGSWQLSAHSLVASPFRLK